MHKFSRPLEIGEDASTGLPVFGFTVGDMFIFDLLLSECGRFPVDPEETYKMPRVDAQELEKLNKLVTEATEQAVNAGCTAVQKALKIESGDLAGDYFSGVDELKPIASAMIDYIIAEYQAKFRASV